MFLFLSALKNVCTIADRFYSKDVAGHRDEPNDDDFLHPMQTNCARHLIQRNQIQLAIFCRLQFFRFEKGKREFSSSDLAGDSLGTHRQFNVPQWIKSEIKIREASCFIIQHPSNSPDISSCDLWLSGMLTGVLKNHKFNSTDEIEEDVTKVWDELIFDEVQSVFHNWMSHLA
jgi:hypothetical protein